MDALTSSWIGQLDALIQQKHMLLHPFYQAWTRGELSKSTLQSYAQEYYHHVKAFPTYLSAIHSRCDDMEVRKCLLSNLIDEEGGSPNHPELWRQFAISLGTEPQDLERHQPAPETKNLINTFQTHCQSRSLGQGVASLYCYESQIPAISASKIDGLKKWYGLVNEEDYHYFTVHETADVEHSQAERDLLKILVSPQEEASILLGAEAILDSLWDFLSVFKC